MKLALFALFITLTGAASAETTLAHGPLPWELTVIVPNDLRELTIPFSVPFTIAPACSPQIISRQAEGAEVIAVSRNFVTVRGNLRAGDELFISCHMNITRRSLDPDAIYVR